MPTILTETRECRAYCSNKHYTLIMDDFAADPRIKEELLSLNSLGKKGNGNDMLLIIATVSCNLAKILK